MKSIISLRKNKEFKRAYLKGAFLSSPNLITYVVKNRFKFTRIGITTGKKTGNAVKRNRSRRIIRAAYFSLKPLIKNGFDIVFVSRAKTGLVKTEDILKDMEYHLKKLGVIK